MIQAIAAVVALVSVSVVLSLVISGRRATTGTSDDLPRRWVTAHHWAVAAVALSGVVAALLPSDLLGAADPSDPWGGYVGRWVTSAAAWTVLMLPVTAVARVVVTRASAHRVRVATVVAAWLLFVAAGWVFISALT